MCIAGRFSSAVAMTAWNCYLTALAVLPDALLLHATLARTTLLISRRGTSLETRGIQLALLIYSTPTVPRPHGTSFSHLSVSQKNRVASTVTTVRISRFTSCLQSAHTTHIPELSYRTYYLICPESVHTVGIVSSPSLLRSYTETGQGTQRGRADQTRKEAGVLLISDTGTIADEFRPSLGSKLLFFCGLDRFTG